MEIVIGESAGFCKGVEFAVKTAREKLKEGKIYCLGEIIHNGQVIKSLENMGMVTVESIEDIPNNAKVIFRAHGEAKKIYNRAKEKKIEIIDLTCGNIKAIHIKAEKAKNDSFILVLGKKHHPETIGTKDFAGKNSYVIENEEDILDAYIKYKKSNLKKIYVIAQTTFSSKYFDELVEKIKINFAEANIKIDKTICEATEIRQKEMKKMAKDFNTMVIIGGKNSSNTKELVKIAKEECKNVLSIEDVNQIEEEKILKSNRVGIMAGASTPQESIMQVKNKIIELKNKGKD